MTHEQRSIGRASGRGRSSRCGWMFFHGGSVPCALSVTACVVAASCRGRAVVGHSPVVRVAAGEQNSLRDITAGCSAWTHSERDDGAEIELHSALMVWLQGWEYGQTFACPMRGRSAPVDIFPAHIAQDRRREACASLAISREVTLAFRWTAGRQPFVASGSRPWVPFGQKQIGPETIRLRANCGGRSPRAPSDACC